MLRVFTFNFISKQVKIESGKTQRGERSRRYEVSENNFRFDESISHKSGLLVLNVNIVFLTSVVVSWPSVVFFWWSITFELNIIFLIIIFFNVVLFFWLSIFFKLSII